MNKNSSTFFHCYINLGKCMFFLSVLLYKIIQGEVAKINTNCLGSSEPLILLEGTSTKFETNKENFEKERIEE